MDTGGLGSAVGTFGGRPRRFGASPVAVVGAATTVGWVASASSGLRAAINGDAACSMSFSSAGGKWKWTLRVISMGIGDGSS